MKYSVCLFALVVAALLAKDTNAQTLPLNDDCETFSVIGLGAGFTEEAAVQAAELDCALEVEAMVQTLEIIGYHICGTHVGFGIPSRDDPGFRAWCPGWVEARPATFEEWLIGVVGN